MAIMNAQMLQETNNIAAQVTTQQQNADALQAQVATLQTEKDDLANALEDAIAARDQAIASNNQNDDMAKQIAAMQKEISALQAENQEIRSNYNVSLVQQALLEKQVDAFAQSQILILIFGTEDTPDALGGLFAGPEGNLLALRGLDTLPAEQTYELWLIDADGTPVPAGLLGADAPTHAAVSVELPGALEDFSAVAVSIEPAAGSEQPTGPIVMVGTRT
ncbi:MAG: anti-sigma factor [Caldilineaceae bacterium]